MSEEIFATNIFNILTPSKAASGNLFLTASIAAVSKYPKPSQLIKNGLPLRMAASRLEMNYRN